MISAQRYEKTRGSTSGDADCETVQMKNFTIGQVRNGVIEHGDNYYGPWTSTGGKVAFDQSPTKAR